MVKKAKAAPRGAMKPNLPKAEVIDLALCHAAQVAADRALRALFNAKEFPDAKFDAYAAGYVQDVWNFALVFAGKLGAKSAHRYARAVLTDAAACAEEPEHAAMLPEAMALFDRIAGWSVDDPEVVAGSTLTQPSPIEGEGSLPQATRCRLLTGAPSRPNSKRRRLNHEGPG